MTSGSTDDGRAGSAGSAASTAGEPVAAGKPALQRSRFGEAPRRDRLPDDRAAPANSSDLGKGPQELAQDGSVHISWRVLIVSSAVIFAFSLWAIFMPEVARTTMKVVVDWIAINLGWYYVLTMALVIGFVLWVAMSRSGDIRLGPDDSRPQYKLPTWVWRCCSPRVSVSTCCSSRSPARWCST